MATNSKRRKATIVRRWKSPDGGEFEARVRLSDADSLGRVLREMEAEVKRFRRAAKDSMETSESGESNDPR
ncbi:MAG: hypothetical protein AAFX78_01835 [Cyanobacteria bacterium J06638_20]